MERENNFDKKKEVAESGLEVPVADFEQQEAGAIKELETACEGLTSDMGKLNELAESEKVLDTLSPAEQKELSEKKSSFSEYGEKLKMALASLGGAALFAGSIMGMQAMEFTAKEIAEWGAIGSLYALIAIVAALPAIIASSKRGAESRAYQRQTDQIAKDFGRR